MPTTWQRPRLRSSAGSASAAWATRWPSASPRAAPTSRSGTARAPRPSRWRRTARRSRTSWPSSPPATSSSCMVSTWDDVKEVVGGPRGLLSGARAPKHGGRVLVDLARRLGRAARAAGGARRRRCWRRRCRQRQGHQGRAAVVRVLGPAAPRSTRRCRTLEADRARARATSARASSRASSRSATTSSSASSSSRWPRSRCSRRRPACRATRSSSS